MPAPNLSPNPIPFNPRAVEKGMLFWYDFSDGADTFTGQKIRPICIIGRTNKNSSRVIVSPVSDIHNYLDNDKLKYPYHVALLKHVHPFLDKDCVVLLDQVITIQKSELMNEWHMGCLQNMDELDQGLFYNYDLYESIVSGVVNRVSSMMTEHMTNFSRK
ncbi:type II toxin-antitoxin system PemK/MazF family toxin [Paenibacillus sp. SZ31]|uniref:type II toxin-antitoxin system PemK/MazF family toxin n=1 Tax=Paenibacillus sp. SZ31 TaxID=2725555 RepID=UPI00146BC430|nr:type II toxin-antitoxin system PemK/MazF family toxin [Paenibacillus sp. SZ31]NMI04803.1 type II toxin-antitoxin system PemK/MazF family toxin [Paenibacillus sp. SZ31]